MYKKVKEIAHAGRSLIPNIIMVLLLIINPTTSCTQRSFSSANSNVFGVRNIHKDLTDAIDLVEVGNEFVSLHDQRYQYLGNLWNRISHKFTSFILLISGQFRPSRSKNPSPLHFKNRVAGPADVFVFRPIRIIITSIVHLHSYISKHVRTLLYQGSLKEKE